MMTKIANTAKNLGYNVLQIFFEDMPKAIQRKHLACWSGYELNDLGLHKEEIKALAAKKDKEPGMLKLKKFSSDGTTIPIIRAYVRKLIAKGFKPDLILLDYIDVVQPSRKYDDVNVGEGSVMRQFEALLGDLNIAGWTAVQGNRSSIKAEVVESDQMGGSIKKGQIGHFIISIAKSLDQKDNGTATAAILKSRFSKDGIILQDIIFNNATIQVDMSEQSTVKSRTEYTKDKHQEQQNTVTALLNSVQKRKNALGGDQGNQ
jgi:replicative DNA helicase